MRCAARGINSKMQKKFVHIDRFTSWEFMIDELCRLNGEFIEKIKGATLKEIEALESLCKGGLASEHKGFLVVMGKSYGDFDIGSSDFSIGALIKLYSDANWYPPSELTVVGVQQNEENEFDFCISRQEGDEGKVIRVCFLGDTESDRLTWKDESYNVAESMQSLVYFYAFKFYKLKAKKWFSLFVQDDDIDFSIDDIDLFFLEIELVKESVFDSWNNFYTSIDSAAVLRKPEGKGYQLQLGTMNCSFLEEFSRKIKHKFGISLIFTEEK